MTTKEYLERVLKSQNLADDSQELKDLRQHRKDVEKILREAFPDASPTIQYGGSNAKGTLDREAYDLDVICYFRNDDTSAGETLKDIFDNVGKALDENYNIEPKTSSIRLRDKKNLIDFHIDVIPGRYVDDSKSDCFIHQNGVDKERLKTNLNVQIDHVKYSGVVPAIRLLKLWKTRRGIQIKQFVFELLIIKLLKDEDKQPGNTIDARLEQSRGSGGADLRGRSCEPVWQRPDGIYGSIVAGVVHQGEGHPQPPGPVRLGGDLWGSR